MKGLTIMNDDVKIPLPRSLQEIVGALLFLPAGTLRYPGGLTLMAILFIPMFCAGLVLMAKNPALLEKRLSDLTKITSIFPASQSAIIRWNSFLCLDCKPEKP